jgi:hypothetical protein
MTTTQHPYIAITTAKKTASKPEIEKTYEEVMTVLRRFSAESIVDAALNDLWSAPKDIPKALQSAPWLTLLLVKWAIQDPQVLIRVGQKIPQNTLHELKQRLWDVEPPDSRKEDSFNIFLMFRTIFHCQLEFQRSESWGFLRWASLIAPLDQNHICRQLFREEIGIEPNDFIDLTFLIYASILDGNLKIDKRFLAPLRNHFGKKIDLIFDLYGLSLPDLRIDLQKPNTQDIYGRGELYEFPHLKRWPLVKARSGVYFCWHPLVFARGIEESVHLRLSKHGQRYTDSFSKVFEKYVTTLVQQTNLPHLTEKDIKQRMGPSSPSVEAIILQKDCNVLIEAKMSLFADDVLVQENTKSVFEKTKHLRKAIRQGQTISNLIRSKSEFFEDYSNNCTDYLLVVTSRELIVGDGNQLLRLYSEKEIYEAQLQHHANLPPKNIFVISIEDFENLTTAVREGSLNLQKTLEHAVNANKNPSTSQLLFSDAMKKLNNKWLRPTLIEVGVEDSIKRMENLQNEIKTSLLQKQTGKQT